MVSPVPTCDFVRVVMWLLQKHIKVVFDANWLLRLMVTIKKIVGSDMYQVRIVSVNSPSHY